MRSLNVTYLLIMIYKSMFSQKRTKDIYTLKNEVLS